MRIAFCLLMAALLFAIPVLSRAQLRLPSVFSDNMVLQQNANVPVWGWAEPGALVSVQPSWTKNPVSTTADASGNWKVMVKTIASTDMHTIRIAARESIEIKNVLLGEVWLCSGQSNMYFPVGRDEESKAFPGVSGTAEEIKAASYPSLRMFLMERTASDTLQQDVKGKWVVCSPETVAAFSAVGYFFGVEIMNHTKRPVGLIRCAWGASTAEAWVSKAVLEADTSLRQALYNEETVVQKKPSLLYNAMLHPIIPYGIKGVLWYQGEANMNRAAGYENLFGTLIRSWRKEWSSELPFYFVQLPPYHRFPPLIREAQLNVSRSLRHTGMAVITDAGDSLNIHPTEKKVVGLRLARWALTHEYGMNLVCSGPVYTHLTKTGDKLRLHFDYADGGLVVTDAMAGELEIAGADRVFRPAKFLAEGPTLLVWSDSVTQPVAVRYSWRPVPHPALFNKAGLPASPFRTDNWQIIK